MEELPRAEEEPGTTAFDTPHLLSPSDNSGLLNAEELLKRLMAGPYSEPGDKWAHEGNPCFSNIYVLISTYHFVFSREHGFKRIGYYITTLCEPD